MHLVPITPTITRNDENSDGPLSDDVTSLSHLTILLVNQKKG